MFDTRPVYGYPLYSHIFYFIYPKKQDDFEYRKWVMVNHPVHG